MKETHRTPGKTTVSPDVLSTIARMAALSVPGISGIASAAGGMERFFRRGRGDGVRIQIQDETVFADLYLIVGQDVNIREVGRNVQGQVTRAIQEMVGMNVGAVDIHVEDIDFEGSEA
jgi:uncharacterized alkaline shock family protein YloU